MSAQTAGPRFDAAHARATNLLTHYLRTVWERAGLTWDSDNTGEVAGIIDAIADLADAVADAKAVAHIEVHTENAPHIYADGLTA